MVQAPASAVAPTLFILAPTVISPTCAGQPQDLVLDASQSPASAGRGLSGWDWSLVSAASNDSALEEVVIINGGSPALVVPEDVVQELPAGQYTFSAAAANWLGQHASTSFSVTKRAATAPYVQVLGGLQQQFMIAGGIRISTLIVLSSVCPGKHEAAASKVGLPPWFCARQHAAALF